MNMCLYLVKVIVGTAIFLMVCYQVNGQERMEKISLELQDTELKKFIRIIEQKTELSFIYGEGINVNRKISLSVKDKPLDEILQIVFDNQPINYHINRSHIILTRKENNAASDGQRYTISGYLMDESSRETLIGAHIVDQISKRGTTTNEFGFYSLTLPAAEVQLAFSYIGYEMQHRTLLLEKDTEINIYLKTSNLLKEVVVSGDKPETGIKATHMGAIDVPISMIKNTPALLGEADIMKTIQMLPGVQAGTEGSAGVYVRGGGPDENLILMDGVPLYNVDHLYGFFSVFTPDAVKKVNFFKGSFPARFGGRLSSVIDVRTNDGDMQNYHGSIGIGLLSSKFHVEGPIVKDRTSFHISGRRSYIDLLTRPFMDKNNKFGYYFYDFNLKLNHRFSDRSRLFLSVYNGKDKLKSTFKENYETNKYKDELDLNWGNLMGALRWNYIISPRLFSNTTVAYTRYRFKVDSKAEASVPSHSIDSKYTSAYSSGIQDLSYSIDFDYRPAPLHHIKFGTGYIYHRFEPEVETSRIKENENGITRDTTYKGIFGKPLYGSEINVYAEDNFNIGENLSINAGFHISLFHLKEKNYFSAQPRISARYQWHKDWALKAAYTKMSQYVHLLSSYTITMPTDLWVPVTKNIKPMQSHQYSLGAYYTGLTGWELSLEGYRKDMRNVLEYKDGATFLGASHNWEDKVEMGKGLAWGVELMAQKTIGKTTGWVAYTLAESKRKFSEDGINSGKWFPYRYDRRHNINMTVNHKFSEKIELSASWEFYTGGTTTLSEEKTLTIEPDFGYVYEQDYIENRNNYRLPPSHRLNIGVNFNKKTKRGERTWNVSVYNIYNAMNPTFVYWDTDYVPGVGSNVRVLKKVTILPCIPSVSYIFKF